MDSQMCFRRKAVGMAVFVLLISVLSVFPALAHGHGHGHHRQSGGYQTESDRQAGAAVQSQTEPAGCPVCPFEDCIETGRHLHDGSEYCGYHHSSGYCDNSCAEICGTNAAANCTSTCHHNYSGR